MRWDWEFWSPVSEGSGKNGRGEGGPYVHMMEGGLVVCHCEIRMAVD